MVKRGCFAVYFFLVFVVTFFSLATAGAQTILYVNGIDATCGGNSPCYTTIQAAINAAGPGNVICIQAGSYRDVQRPGGGYDNVYPVGKTRPGK